jgi:hypothetical protein
MKLWASRQMEGDAERPTMVEALEAKTITPEGAAS